MLNLSLVKEEAVFDESLLKLPSKMKNLLLNKKIIIIALIVFALYAPLWMTVTSAVVALSFVSLFHYKKRKSHLKIQEVETQVNQVVQIQIFQGDDKNKGIAIESLKALQRSIPELVVHSDVVLCTHEELKPARWSKKTILVFPGGKCSEWNELLSESRQSKIFEWFKSGGRILGICAGAYYCSERSTYQSLFRIRKIGIFPGTCQGPAYSCDLKVVKVRWEKDGQEGDIAVIQGGYFIPEPPSTTEYEVLARYTEEPHINEIAVVACRKEKGVAILSAPHWEFDSVDLNGLERLFPHLPIRIQQQRLETSLQFRQKCLREMLEELSA